MAYTNIDDPSAYFQIATYTGAGANQTVTNDGNSDLQPDWLWIKRRNAGYAHALFDSNRGLGSSNPPMLESDSTAAENSNQNWISGVGTDSFTIGINEQNLSNTSGTYVAWQWKANGGTTSSNTDGAITSTVQVNSDAGFSILTYTMGSGNETVGHGLGVTPDIIITKARYRSDANGFWSVYTTVIDGSLDYLKLNTTDVKFNSSLAAPTSTVFTGAGSGTVSYRDFVAYCFASKQGYSKFGKYVGNGNANGPFVYTGFKPAFVMVKRSDSADSWAIFDNKRSDSGGFNVIDKHLRADTSGAEYDPGGSPAAQIDILSNGFKQREANGQLNASGGSYIYMAFAENPFTTSTGIPTTAR